MNQPSELPQKSPEKLPFELLEESLPESSSELPEELPKELLKEPPEMDKPETGTNEPFTEDDVTVQKISGTTYIVTSEYNKNASEGLLDKLWRLIKNDME